MNIRARFHGLMICIILLATVYVPYSALAAPAVNRTPPRVMTDSANEPPQPLDPGHVVSPGQNLPDNPQHYLLDELGGWDYPFGMEVETIGIGMGSRYGVTNNPATLDIPNAANVQYIIAQVVLKVSPGIADPPSQVIFTTSAGQLIVLTEPTWYEDPNVHGQYNYEVILEPADQITAYVVGVGNPDYYTPRAFVAYVFRNSGASYANVGDLPHGYAWWRALPTPIITHTEVFTIPAMPVVRDVQVDFVVTDVGIGCRSGRVRAAAGPISQTETFIVPNVGEELHVTTLTLHNVPGNITQVVAQIISPPDYPPPGPWCDEDQDGDFYDEMGESLYFSGVNVRAPVTPPPATIGDRVWHDANRNGIQDAGEAGLAGVTVNLYTAGGTLVGSTVTSSEGWYLFEGLEPGEYYVCFVAPAGYQFSPVHQGGDDALDSDADALTGCAPVTTLSPGETDLTWDAGLFLPLASLGDLVWHDLNSNGIQEPGEPGIANVVVELHGPSGLVGTTTTTDTGYYEFVGLAAGTYTVTIAAANFATGGALAGWYASPPNQGGNDALDSDGDLVYHRASVTLAAGEHNPTIDFGFFRTCIELLKTGPVSVSLGQTIIYHFRVENCSDVVLHGGAQVYDPLLDPSGNPIWDGILQPGQVVTFTRSYVPTIDDCGLLTNTATAIGHPQAPYGYLPDVTDMSQWTVQVLCDACTYVVSPNGNDDNPGTPAQPWRTLRNPFPYSGTGPLQPGDILCVQPNKDAQGNLTPAEYGPYYVGVKVSGLASAPIRIVVDADADGYADPYDPTASPGSSGMVILNGRIDLSNISYVSVEGFTIVGVVSMYGLPDYYSPTSPWVTGGFWEEMPHRVDSAPDVYLPWTDYHWENRRGPVCQKFPAFMALHYGQTVQLPHACNGSFNASLPDSITWKPWVAGILISNAHGVVVRHNTVSLWGGGIALENIADQLAQVPEAVVEKNYAHHCAGGVSLSNTVDSQVRNNSFRHILGRSVNVWPGSHYILIEGNDSRYVGLDHYNLSPTDTESLKITNVTLRGNIGLYGGLYSVIMQNPGTSGVHLNNVGVGNVIENNYMAYQMDETSLDGNGFALDCTPCGCPASPTCTNNWGVVFQNNIAYRNMGAGINTTGSYYTVIANNTSVANGYDFPTWSWIKYHGLLHGAGIRICYGNDKQSRTVNNLLYDNRWGGIDYYSIDPNSTFDYNYILPSSNGVVVVLDKQPFTTLPVTPPFGSHNILGNNDQVIFVNDGQFSGAEDGDISGFHLISSALVINAGTSSYAPATDIDGDPRPQGSGWDIGADEYSDTIPPAAPGNLVATAQSQTQISLTWVDNSTNEYGFKVERWNGSAWMQIATVGTNVAVYADTGLSANTTYYYRVQAYNAGGDSAYSNVSSTTTSSFVYYMPIIVR